MRLMEPDSFFEDNLGKFIAKGTSREVYEFSGDDSSVIKKVHLPSPSSNFIEWYVWQAVKKMAVTDIMNWTPNHEIQNLFAECRSISESGRYLIMERLTPITNSDWDRIPQIPEWVNDRKPSAFGKTAEGYVKLLDYAAIDFYSGLSQTLVSVPFSLKPTG